MSFCYRKKSFVLYTGYKAENIPFLFYLVCIYAAELRLMRNRENLTAEFIQNGTGHLRKTNQRAK